MLWGRGEFKSMRIQFKNKTLGVTAFIKEKNQCKVIRLFLQLS